MDCVSVLLYTLVTNFKMVQVFCGPLGVDDDMFGTLWDVSAPYNMFY